MKRINNKYLINCITLSKNTGITLLELLIVIIIVGILASVSIMQMSKLKEKQKGEACANNMRMIFAAWRIYNMKSLTPLSGYKAISVINDTLNTNIQEKNFGRYRGNGTFEYHFYKYVNNSTPANSYLRLFASKQYNPYKDRYIYCYYYYNRDPQEYVWTGTWFTSAGFPKPKETWAID